MELQGLYESSQRERAELEAELQRCRAELDQLAGRKAQVRGHKEGQISVHGLLLSSKSTRAINLELQTVNV